MFLGKIIGGLIGFFSFGSFGFGFVGLFVGVGLGHYFDRGRAALESSFNPEVRAQIEAAFKSALFPVLGALAKADGRVSEDEISSTETLMQQLGIVGDEREAAIKAFQSGVSKEAPLEAVMDPFIQATARRRELHQIFLTYLLSLAFADGELHESEEQLLLRVAQLLGYSKFAFNRLVGMVKAQSYFYQRRESEEQHQSSADNLKRAYAALGVSETASKEEVKRAYRKLMSEYHPDKLAGQGVPQEVLKVATARSQEIQAAYDMIKKSS